MGTGLENYNKNREEQLSTEKTCLTKKKHINKSVCTNERSRGRTPWCVEEEKVTAEELCVVTARDRRPALAAEPLKR